MTIIGVDPHPDSHTAAVLDHAGTVLLTRTVPNRRDGLQRLLGLAAEFPDARWAIEGAGNRYVTPLVKALLARGEVLTSVPPSLTSQYRARRGRKKNDEVDAVNVARAALANPDLPALRHDGRVEELKRLSRTRARLARHLKAERMALRALPPSCGARPALEGVIRALEGAIAELNAQLAERVKALQPELLEQRGIGPVLGAVVLAEVGDVRRFGSADAFAAYCGAAPVERSSGRTKRVQVNTGGNRRLNYALHLVALVRLRVDAESQAYVARKLKEGKTRRAALRHLKTVVARRLYRVLRASAGMNSPGSQLPA